MEEVLKEYTIGDILDYIGIDEAINYFNITPNNFTDTERLEGLCKEDIIANLNITVEDFSIDERLDGISQNEAIDILDITLDYWDSDDMLNHVGRDQAKEYFELFDSISEIIDNFGSSEVLSYIDEDAIANYLDIYNYIKENFTLKAILENLLDGEDKEELIQYLVQEGVVTPENIMKANVFSSVKARTVLKTLRESYYDNISYNF